MQIEAHDTSCSIDGAISDLIPKLRNAHDLEAVTGLLSAELSSDPFDFADITTFGLGADNRRQVHYLLARLTAFVEVESGRPNRIGEYLDEQRSHQIEHIWPNHYDRYRDLVKNTAAFDRSRNRFGALLLLHRSDNGSYRDEPYGAKVEYHRGSQNLLAASLHPTTHTRNPTFGRFLKRYELAPLMRPYPTDFDDKAILAGDTLVATLSSHYAPRRAPDSGTTTRSSPRCRSRPPTQSRSTRPKASSTTPSRSSSPTPTKATSPTASSTLPSPEHGKALRSSGHQ